jgi:hypothetical protein
MEEVASATKELAIFRREEERNGGWNEESKEGKNRSKEGTEGRTERMKEGRKKCSIKEGRKEERKKQ